MRGASTLVLVLGLGLVGCQGMVNKTVRKRVVPAGKTWTDLEQACAFGVVGAAAFPIVTEKSSPDGMMLSGLAGGVCLELEAWEAELQAALVLAGDGGSGEARAAAAIDATLQARRLHARAAERFEMGWQAWASRYGEASDTCPRIPTRETEVYLVGVFSGLLAVVNDAAGGGANGIPQNRLLEVARAASCLDDEALTGMPAGLQAAGWATIPGSGPEGVDPWTMLEEAAQRGDAAGQGIPRALLVFASKNTGQDERLESAITAFADVPINPEADWALLDAYARRLALHQADLLWIAEKGHRATAFGQLPPEPVTAEDPFGGDDPFGSSDPFGTPPSGPAPSPSEAPVEAAPDATPDTPAGENP